MLKIFRYFEETARNFNLGMLAHVGHRISGIALSLFIIGHLYSLGWVRTGGATGFDESMNHYNNILGHIAEYLILLAVLFHTFNGLRVITGDFWGQTKGHKKLFWYAFTIMAIIALVSVVVFFPELRRA